jgi:hypothetical protein
MKSDLGPPMTLGSAARAVLRLIVCFAGADKDAAAALAIEAAMNASRDWNPSGANWVPIRAMFF